MRDLIERLTAATGPDIELGAEIICRIRGLRYLSVETRKTMLSEAIAVCAEDDMRERFEFWVNDPTASFDAALTLVPEGWMWDVSSSGCAWIMRNDDSICDSQIVIGGVETPAIALCIAALKAREDAK